MVAILSPIGTALYCGVYMLVIAAVAAAIASVK